MVISLCDKCKTEQDHDKLIRISIHCAKTMFDYDLYVCPKCYEDFKKYIYNK